MLHTAKWVSSQWIDKDKSPQTNLKYELYEMKAACVVGELGHNSSRDFKTKKKKQTN